MGQSIIKKISLEIDKNKERRHVIIANKNISKRFLYSSLEKVNNKNLKVYTPDEYIFRECKDPWYIDMKNYYSFIRDNYECNFIHKDFLHKLDNLKFEKHRKSL